MKSVKYLLRLDDACPTMNSELWHKMEVLLERYGIKPIVGVIPHNEDPLLKIEGADERFWAKVKSWENKGWTIALHGYNHCYISKEGLKGLNPLWERSEFSGVPLNVQKEKVREGVAFLKEHCIIPSIFFAPSHTFDQNTLVALKEESDIRIISDTIATKPYIKNGFVFIPQTGGHCSEMRIPGTWTFCLHPNSMTDRDFAQTESFISNHFKSFVCFEQLDLNGLKSKDLLSRILSCAYFTRRRLKGIK